jgi:hypothetical protein
VEVLRAERAHQRRNGGAALSVVSGEPPSQADIAALREALVVFGDRVAELAETAETSPAQRAN